MKIRNSKIFLLLIILLVPFFVTGCGNNNSAKNVATEMVEKLSKGNYQNMDKIFYQEKDSYFDDLAFEKTIKDQSLDIKGNKKIKVKEVSEEITNDDGQTTVQVKIAIDNNKIFTIDTIEVDGKWYVYDPDFYDGSMEIVVPKGSTVKLNNKKLSKDYLKTEKRDIKVKYPDSYKSVKLEDVSMDVYKINKPLKGKYSVAVEGKNIKSVKDVIYTYSKASSSDSDNYEYDYDYSDRNVEYAFQIKSKNDEAKTYIKDYLNNVYSNATSTKSFDGVKKYFDESSDEYSDIKSNYESLIDKVGSTDSSYISDFKVNDLEYKGTYYFDENHTVSMFEYELTYKMNYSSGRSYDRDTDMTTIAVLKKDSKNKYIITKGYSLFAR